MAVNKVIYDGNTLIDLTSDTVTAESLLSGYTAHDASGASITGTASGGGATRTIATATATVSSNATSISFTVAGEPLAFSVKSNTAFTMTSGYYIIMAIQYDGTTTDGTYLYYKSGGGSGHATYYSSSYYSFTYNNGTLTVSSSSSTNGGYFRSGSTYKLVYVY